MLKHISLHKILTGLKDTARRFPFPFISSVIATIIIIYLVWYSDFNSSSTLFLTKCAAVSIISFFLTTALTLMFERRSFSRQIEILFHIGVVVLVALCTFIAPTNNIVIIQSLVLGFCAFFFVFVAGFLSDKEDGEVWMFIFTTIRRIALSVLFGIVAFIGIMLALGALDILLGIKIDNKVPPSIFFFIACFGSPIHALAGLARISDKMWLANEKYPTFIRFLTQFIILPLVAIYMVILYLYCGKAIISWNWPSGKMIYFTIAFFIPALLSVIFLAPLKDEKEFPWIKKVEKLFFIAALPLMFPYFYAILVRITGDGRSAGYLDSVIRSGFSMTGGNGLTWQRGFVVLFGVWFLGVALYRLFAKNTNIKTIILSGVIILSVFSIGPWGVFSLSNWSQMTRLRYTLEKHNAIKDGKIVFSGKVDGAIGRDIFSLISYISEFGDPREIRAMLPQEKQGLFDSKRKNGEIFAYDLAEIMGLKYTDTGPSSLTKYIDFRTGDDEISIVGSEYFIPFHYGRYNNENLRKKVSLSNKQVIYFDMQSSKDETHNLIFISSATDEKKYAIDFSKKAEAILNAHPQQSSILLLPTERVWVYQTHGAKITILINSLSGMYEGSTFNINSVDASVFVGPAK
jgi:hypothetical protein